MAVVYDKRETTTHKTEARMLVLSRKPGEQLRIGDEITITVVRIGPNSVRIGIDAPESMKVLRVELEESDERDDEAAD